MSGPVSTIDVPAARAGSTPSTPACLEVTESREATVGGVTVHRALPRRQRRTVGAWCFLDHLAPTAVTDERRLEIGPHPHIGLQTVTWLLQGEQVHRDSLGSEQAVRPGELNLMTAGAGVVHAEESEDYRGDTHGVQLWVAQPEATRHGPAAFEHHGDLPRVDLKEAVVAVLAGEFAGSRSAARTDTPLVGLDLDVRPGTSVLPLERRFEYALVVLSGALSVEGRAVGPDLLGYLGAGRDELAVTAREPTRALLVGGEPFGEEVFMWWNFVARSQEEVTEAYTAWTSHGERFPDPASTLPRIPAPRPLWLPQG